MPEASIPPNPDPFIARLQGLLTVSMNESATLRLRISRAREIVQEELDSTHCFSSGRLFPFRIRQALDGKPDA